MHIEFPGASLAATLFRQITKPLSQRIVKYASDRPIFRKYALKIPGRIYYRLEQRIERLKTLPLQKQGQEKKKLVPVTDEKAIEAGSHLMIEIVVFMLIGLSMTFEWIRSQWKSEAREERYNSNLRFLVEHKDLLTRKLARLEEEKRKLEALHQDLRNDPEPVE